MDYHALSLVLLMLWMLKALMVVHKTNKKTACEKVSEEDWLWLEVLLLTAMRSTTCTDRHQWLLLRINVIV